MTFVIYEYFWFFKNIIFFYISVELFNWKSLSKVQYTFEKSCMDFWNLSLFFRATLVIGKKSYISNLQRYRELNHFKKDFLLIISNLVVPIFSEKTH